MLRWAPSTLTVDDAILEYHELGGREYGGGVYHLYCFLL